MEAATHRITTPAHAATSSSGSACATGRRARAAPAGASRNHRRLGRSRSADGTARAGGRPPLADQLSGPDALIRALIITLTAGPLESVLVMMLSGVNRDRCARRCCETRSGSALLVPHAPDGAEGSCGSSLCRYRRHRCRGAPAHPGPRGRDLRRVPRIGRWGGSAGRSVGLVRDHRRAVVFNTALGEEFLFRGYLLPRMNGLLRPAGLARQTACSSPGYHLHMPWVDTDHAAGHVHPADPAKALPQCAHQHRRTQRAEHSSCSGSCSRWCSRAENRAADPL